MRNKPIYKNNSRKKKAKSNMAKIRQKALWSVMALTVTFGANTSSVYALTSDLSYDYKTENTEEFFIGGQRSGVNFDGEIPDFLHDIYNFAPQPINNSEYGSTISLPTVKSQTMITNAPNNAPVPSFIAPSTQTTGYIGNYSQNTNTGAGSNVPSNGSGISSSGVGAGSGAGTNQTTNAPSEPQLLPSNTEIEKSPYQTTDVSSVRKSDGEIGVLKIPKISLTVKAYDGDTFTAMKKGIGHIAQTSAFNGNVGLVGHNRGTSNYFGKLKNLSVGDEMTYETKLGKKTYTVEKVYKIAEDDWSGLSFTSDNRLTLITCVENVPSQRLMVQAVEKR